MLTGKLRLMLFFVTVAVCLGQITGCKEDQPSQQGGTEPNNPSATATVKPVAPPASYTKPTLGSIIAKGRSWAPAYVKWYGEQTPDFTVTDITGKKHTLSEYRGRNVMLVFWATWCGPCIREIPHLIELRNTFSENTLVILALSYNEPRNTTAMVKKFVARNPVINYPVVSVDMSALPRPYNFVIAIPCTFYIDPQGKIKLASEGLVPVSQMKQIIEAER
jgi:peroxiredoxin